MKFGIIKISILLLLFIPFLNAFSQSTWVLPIGGVLATSFDGGDLIIDWPEKDELYKLDRKGDTLWSVPIDDSLNFIPTNIFEDSTSGDLYICGMTKNQVYYDKFAILKLNACGETQWFKEHDYSEEFFSLKDVQFLEDHIVTVFTGEEYDFSMTPYPVLLFSKFDLDGEELWQRNIYGFEYGAQYVNLVAAVDSGYLLSGTKEVGSYPDTVGWPNYLSSYLVKLDEDGIEEWDYIYDWETDSVGVIIESNACSTVALEDGSFLTFTTKKGVLIGNHYTAPGHLFKTSSDGELIWSKEILQTDSGWFHRASLNLLNDSTLFLATSFDDTSDYHNGYGMIQLYQIDSSGYIIDSAQIEEVKGMLWKVNLDSENKALFCATERLGPNDFTVSTFKINAETLVLDSFILVDNHIYDSFCEGGLGIDNHSGLEDNFMISFAPNPGSENINFTFSPSPQLDLQMVDCMGRKIWEQEMNPNVGNYQLDISKYPSGMYFIQVQSDGKLLQSEKLIIE